MISKSKESTISYVKSMENQNKQNITPGALADIASFKIVKSMRLTSADMICANLRKFLKQHHKFVVLYINY